MVLHAVAEVVTICGPTSLGKWWWASYSTGHRVDRVAHDRDAGQTVVNGLERGLNQVVALVSADHRLVVLTQEVEWSPKS